MEDKDKRDEVLLEERKDDFLQFRIPKRLTLLLAKHRKEGESYNLCARRLLSGLLSECTDQPKDKK